MSCEQRDGKTSVRHHTVDLRESFEYSRYTRPNFSLVHFGFVNKGYRYTLFAELEVLEGDVLTHVHLENHVLMPRFAAGDAE